MKLFKRRGKSETPALPAVQTAAQGNCVRSEYPASLYSYELFEKLRRTVPLVDAAISKLVRLIGSFHVECDDPSRQATLDRFLREVPVGLTGQSIYSFIDSYFDSLLVYGNAVGEIVLDKHGKRVEGLWNGKVTDVGVRPGTDPMQRQYFLRKGTETVLLPHPERILFTALKAPDGGIYGVSLLQGMPVFASLLMRIYECVGQNFDRAGNVRYAVTYRPSADSADAAYAGERAKIIAQEWSDGMQAAKHGEIRDFVSVGDVDIKVIGAEGIMPETEIPVRQILEQMLSKLSVPPFLLGLSWSSTERMSAQQADILTSELEYYRRLLEPVICRIAGMFLAMDGCFAPVRVVWDDINLQDEVELAQARLYRAQASEIEQRVAANATNSDETVSNL
ncbi:MAG: serine/threonine protein phosphatase [Oscillospiraceae bacterium]|nr:serine/threonine protein phosphatase [Oscillospiraceae bacterium]